MIIEISINCKFCTCRSICWRRVLSALRCSFSIRYNNCRIEVFKYLMICFTCLHKSTIILLYLFGLRWISFVTSDWKAKRNLEMIREAGKAFELTRRSSLNIPFSNVPPPKRRMVDSSWQSILWYVFILYYDITIQGIGLLTISSECHTIISHLSTTRLRTCAHIWHVTRDSKSVIIASRIRRFLVSCEALQNNALSAKNKMFDILKAQSMEAPQPIRLMPLQRLIGFLLHL